VIALSREAHVNRFANLKEPKLRHNYHYGIVLNLSLQVRKPFLRPFSNFGKAQVI